MAVMITGNMKKRYIHWRFFWMTEWSNGIRIP